MVVILVIEVNVSVVSTAAASFMLVDMDMPNFFCKVKSVNVSFCFSKQNDLAILKLEFDSHSLVRIGCSVDVEDECCKLSVCAESLEHVEVCFCGGEGHRCSCLLACWL